VEAGGVEPPSGNLQPGASTCIAGELNLALPDSQRQDSREDQLMRFRLPPISFSVRLSCWVDAPSGFTGKNRRNGHCQLSSGVSVIVVSAYLSPTFLTSPVGTSARSPDLNDPRRNRGAPKTLFLGRRRTQILRTLKRTWYFRGNLFLHEPGEGEGSSYLIVKEPGGF